MPIEKILELLARVIATMRQDSLDALGMWLTSAENERGGTLVLQAPCVIAKRTLTEAGFRTERYAALA